MIGCECSVCSSEHPRNTRLRSSIVLRAGELTLLVDSGPDLRQQALRSGLTAIDAILYTHAHVDHVAGFDELRAFCWHRNSPLPLYATEDCLNALQHMYPWAFTRGKVYPGYVHPAAHIVSEAFAIESLQITPLPVKHGNVTTIGYRFDYNGTSAAYMPDVKEIPPETYEILSDCQTLIIDALGPKQHPTHLSIPESIAVSQKCGMAQTYFTHMSHSVDLSQDTHNLPSGFNFAYDGLILTL